MEAGIIVPNAAPTLPGGARTPAETARAAEQFEAAYLSTVLATMFKDIKPEAPFNGGAGEDAFGSFLSEAMAKVVAKAGGVGLADSLKRELLRLQEASQ